MSKEGEEAVKACTCSRLYFSYLTHDITYTYQKCHDCNHPWEDHEKNYCIGKVPVAT